MTHLQVLMRELARHGRVTYRELRARYPRWRYNGFVNAVGVARRRGLVTGPERNGGVIVGIVCDCCGRSFVQPGGAQSNAGREEGAPPAD